MRYKRNTGRRVWLLAVYPLLSKSEDQQLHYPYIQCFVNQVLTLG